jgi:hypothetical protein
MVSEGKFHSFSHLLLLHIHSTDVRVRHIRLFIFKSLKIKDLSYLAHNFKIPQLRHVCNNKIIYLLQAWIWMSPLQGEERQRGHCCACATQRMQKVATALGRGWTGSERNSLTPWCFQRCPYFDPRPPETAR